MILRRTQHAGGSRQHAPLRRKQTAWPSLKTEFRACRLYPQHSEGRYDGDDPQSDHHLQNREAPLLRGCFTVGVHL